MTTTIRTSSKNYFNKIQKYLTNKRVFFTPSLNLGVYALTIFDLSEVETTSLLNKMTKDSALIRSEDIMAEITKRREKALEFFGDHLFEDTLYLLDEPENSMAPAYQMELAHEIALLAYRLNSQFIIATHSPFMLSIESARIYDLDARPARIREWYELENMQTYYQLFCHFLIIIF